MDDTREPLRDRLPDYLGAFSVMAAIAVAVGLVVAFFSSVDYVSGAGYGLIFLGVGMLAVGGTQGGGYANLGVGAVGTLFGSRRHDEDYSDAGVRRGSSSRVDPRERLRRGLRPEANPTAFWLVIGGLVAIGAGIGLLNSLG